MDKQYQPNEVESRIYALWEKGDYFRARIPEGMTPEEARRKHKPFSIILPLPNANDPMHMGHALFTIEDILIRWHRMMGEVTLWLPGGDHAGIETQFVFEKQLAKEGKSRFDFDRETLYRMIAEFVEKNKNINKDQMKILGFSMDWSRYHYSLEPEIVAKVLATFRKLYADGLIYRAGRIVNYCTRCGTAFSDLEIRYQEQTDALYYLDYGPIQIATTRPETIFADTAVAVNPKDKRFKALVGQKAVIPLANREIPIIADELVEKDFGTGALKITPAHDPVDFDIGQRHGLASPSVIDIFNGKIENENIVPQKYRGLKPLKAREIVVADLGSKLIKTEPLTHSVGHCYRCGSVIEPLIMPQWYVKTKPLAEPAIRAVREGKTKIIPKKRFEKMYFDWMENIRDWNISRQIVWGPRIPVWYKVDGNEERIWAIFLTKNKEIRQGSIDQHLRAGFTLEDIEQGIQRIYVPLDESDKHQPEVFVDKEKPETGQWIQETDTFDTWFLSGQWPLTTLGFNHENPAKSSDDFKYFYPTSVMDTLWDILFFWVARMMMFGLYLAKEVPFEVVHLHARVVDEKGQKMSKSKFNVVNPQEMIDKYGTDALRLALIFGVSPGSDIAIGDDKVRAMRNFVNKVWNVGRFILMNQETQDTGNRKQEIVFYSPEIDEKLEKEDLEILKDLEELIKVTTKHLQKYRFDLALEGIYQFIWHRLADEYLENSKERLRAGDPYIAAVLRHVYLKSVALLHPFAPFVTEEIWQVFAPYRKYQEPLVVSKWPGLK